jgi:dihydrofolate reductase
LRIPPEKAESDEEDTVGRIVITEFISLDGVIEDPGGGESSFAHSGWSFEFDRGEEGDRFKLDELMAADVQLLGRITYEGFAAAWPAMRESTGEFGEKMNSMPKYVVSTTLSDDDASWENSSVIRDDVADAVRNLKQEVEGDILVQGSATLAQTLIEHGLVDELRLMVFPVVLGAGKRLFGETAAKTTLRVKESKIVGDGVATFVYQSAG